MQISHERVSERNDVVVVHDHHVCHLRMIDLGLATDRGAALVPGPTLESVAVQAAHACHLDRTDLGEVVNANVGAAVSTEIHFACHLHQQAAVAEAVSAMPDFYVQAGHVHLLHGNGPAHLDPDQLPLSDAAEILQVSHACGLVKNVAASKRSAPA